MLELRKTLMIAAASVVLGAGGWSTAASAGSITIGGQEGAASCTSTGATTGSCPNGGDISVLLTATNNYNWSAGGTNYGNFNTGGSGNDEDLGGTAASLPTVITTNNTVASLNVASDTAHTFTMYVTSQGLTQPVADTEWEFGYNATLPPGWSVTESVYLSESNGLYNAASCSPAPCATTATGLAAGSTLLSSQTWTNSNAVSNNDGLGAEAFANTKLAIDPDVTEPFSITEVFTVTGFWDGSSLQDHSAPLAISVTALPVPEPASLTLLGSALFGFGMWRRRRSQKA